MESQQLDRSCVGRTRPTYARTFRLHEKRDIERRQHRTGYSHIRCRLFDVSADVKLPPFSLSLTVWMATRPRASASRNKAT
jgi:hypothetical protein